MSVSSETQVKERQILLVGPYGVLGNPEHNQDSSGRFWGLHRHAPELKRQLTGLRDLRIIP